MTKAQLLASAQTMGACSNSTVEEYKQQADSLVAEVNKLMLNRSDIEQLVGKGNVNMMKDNHANHARFMATIMQHYQAEVLLDTVLWVFRAYRSHGFSSVYWASQLNAWFEVLPANLSDAAFQEVRPFYTWMQVNIPAFVLLADEKQRP